METNLDLSVRIQSFIDGLSEEECRRVLAVAMYGEHRCHGARIGCCGHFRCEPCHITHLRSQHGEHAVTFWAKLSQSSSLTWPGRLPTSPSKPPKQRKVANDPVKYIEVPSTEAEQLALLEARMRKYFKLQGVKV